MRNAAKFAVTSLFAAGLIGGSMGMAAAAPASHGHSSNHNEAYQACVKEQNVLGLINLNLDLLNQCIANYNR
jgi:hypothetical protein